MKIETNQDAFDFAVRHMHKQREKSVRDDSPKCLYRGENGKMCIIGAMIDDAHYDSEFEFTGLSDDKIKRALQNSGVTIDENVPYWSLFYKELQQVHDKWQGLNMDDLKDAFITLASRNDLNTKVFDDLNW